MNNWLKIGIPVLVVALLVISAVSITIAVTNGNRGNQLATASAQGTIPVVKYGACPNCPGFSQDTGTDQGTTTNPVYIPQGKQGSCCVGSTQAAAPTQTPRGSCCGAR